MLHHSGLVRLREDMTLAGLWDARLEEVWEEALARAKERSRLEGPPDLLRVGIMEVRASGLAEIGELQKAQRFSEEASALRRKKADLDARKTALLAAEEAARVKAARISRRVILDRVKACGQKIDRICREHFGPSARFFPGLLPEEVVTNYEAALRAGSLLQAHDIILQVPSEEQGDRQVELGVLWHVSREYRNAVKARAGIVMPKSLARAAV